MKVCCSVVGQPLNGLCSFDTFNKPGKGTEVKRDQHVLGAKHRRDNAYRWKTTKRKSFMAILLEQMRLNWMTPVPAES